MAITDLLYGKTYLKIGNVKCGNCGEVVSGEVIPYTSLELLCSSCEETIIEISYESAEEILEKQLRQ